MTNTSRSSPTRKRPAKAGLSISPRSVTVVVPSSSPKRRQRQPRRAVARTSTTSKSKGTNNSNISDESTVRKKLDFCSSPEKNRSYYNETPSGLDGPDNNNDVVVRSAMILNIITDEAIVNYMFGFLGPLGTARCAQVCRTWHTASHTNPVLWRTFVEQDFPFSHTHPPPPPPSNSNSAATTTSVDWKALYAYVALQQRHVKASRLQGSVLFADDGGSFGLGRYPAANALRPEEHLVWCTNTGVDTNIDLVIELETPCLVTGFVAANGGKGFSAPLKEALVFVSMDPPDLKAARIYNNHNLDNAVHSNNGSRWVKKLACQHNTMKSHDGSTTSSTSTSTTTTAAQEESKSSPLPQMIMQMQASYDEPVAAFEFPNLSAAYAGRSKVTLNKPRVGRYVHFKLLNSFSPPGLEDISDNIDVMHLHTHGIPLEKLDTLVPAPCYPSNNNNNNNNHNKSQKSMPEYQRQHALRPSRIGHAAGWVDLFLVD